MDSNQEKELLLKGIADLKQQMLFTRGARSLDLLDRLETLRNCLEILISKELLIHEEV